MKKMYKYETHMHTSESSRCGGSSAECQIKALKALGYHGAFVTDHFFNGNSAIPKDLPWDVRVHYFCQGYEEAKKVGDEIGLQVFFGVEFGYWCADILAYGIDKQFLLEHPELETVHPNEVARLVHEAGGFLVQAHPFREGDYIPDIKLYPYAVDGVETVNTSHWTDEPNIRADWFANAFKLPKTGGSDCHKYIWHTGGGVAVEKPFETPKDYYNAMVNGELTILKNANEIDPNTLDLGVEDSIKRFSADLLPDDLKKKVEEYYKNKQD